MKRAESPDAKPPVIAVIQGPVKSVGRTFQTTRIGRTEHDESKLVVSFDASGTILENTRRFSRLGVGVIYSGWASDCPATLRDELAREGAGVILSDPGEAPSRTFVDHPFRGILAIDNRSKQFYSLLRALDGIEDRARRIVIKLRSDISLDVEQLLDEIRRSERYIRAGAFLVQHLRSRDRSRKPGLWIPDFWFAGRGDVLHHIARDLVTRSLSQKSYSPSPHLDLGHAILRYHWSIFPKIQQKSESLKALARTGNVPAMITESLRRVGHLLLQQKMVSLYRRNLLIPAGPDIEHSLCWRGDSFRRHAHDYPDADRDAIYAAGGAVRLRERANTAL